MRLTAGAPSIEIVQQIARKFLSAWTNIERVTSGASTYVYRIYTRRGEVLYLRILPEAGSTFAPEVLVHALLRREGVSVPEVIYYEPANDRLGLSVMATKEIPGKELASRTTAVFLSKRGASLR